MIILYHDNINIKKVPVLTEKELNELGKVLHLHKGNEIMKRRFWKDIYKKRGLEYK